MSKAVLLSIRPEWCVKIASGEKTVEVRKTRPKIVGPFKVYIYCTQPSPYNPCVQLYYRRPNSTIYDTFPTKRIIGEFVCDWCDPFFPEEDEMIEYIEKWCGMNNPYGNGGKDAT